jgi:hypothetical protein
MNCSAPYLLHRGLAVTLRIFFVTGHDQLREPGVLYAGVHRHGADERCGRRGAYP